MNTYLIKNGYIINEGRKYYADLLLKDGRIEKIAPQINTKLAVKEINAEGNFVLPGCIDDQVHFREPGLTHKGNLASESKAAVAGGITSFMEMPNTNPPALTQALLEEKYQIAQQQAIANYSFFMGTSNDNYDEVMKTNEKKKNICGIKIFMGSSTGNLLVDNPLALEKIFGGCEVLIATHCEEEKMIQANLKALQQQKTLTAADHPIIRNDEVCFESSWKAIQYAQKHGSRLHILHITTAKELQLFTNLIPLKDKNITAEVCVHHLHFTANDYDRLGNLIKCNPAIKAPNNKQALWEALLDNRLDVIATDHAPHTLAEKGFVRDINGKLVCNNPDYLHAHAGLPLVQHSLLLMLQYVQNGSISIEKMVEKMSHAVADCFQIKDRGYLREGYFADIVLVNQQQTTTVIPENILYKCNWSPFEGTTFPMTIEKTFVNGHLAYANGVVDASVKGKRLEFNR
ncbi:MAG: dihydroorotase [Bacteroidota bacterium]|nr:dihydroorotase [Bacteroidota bacterium]